MKRFNHIALLVGLLLLALPAFAADTVQITLDSSSPRVVGTGLTANSGDRFLVQAEGAIRLTGGRPFMDGWFDPSGLGSLERASQVFSDSPYGILLGTWYSSLEDGIVLGELTTLNAQSAYFGNELKLGLNMSDSDRAAIQGEFQVHVTRFTADEAEEATVIVNSNSPRPLGTGITVEQGDKLLVIGQGAAQVVGFRPVTQGWFDASGLGSLRRVGQVFSDTPYGSLLGTFTSSLGSGFYVGDVMSRTPPSSHYGDEFKVGLNMDADDQASMQGAIVVHVLRIKNVALSSAGDLPGRDGIVGVENYPNPFNPSTTVSFELARQQDVRVSVVNLAGEVVRTLASERFAAGRHEMSWDGRDSRGQNLASGTYFLRLETQGGMQSHKLTLVK